jgi:putative tricarboxylic transport membrane protein
MEGARRMPPSMTFGPGAGFLPFWLGVAMAVLAILLFAGATREPVTPGARRPFPTGRAILRIAFTAVSLAAFILLLEPVGFLPATALLSAFLLGVIQRERLAITLGVAILNAAALWVIFEKLLGVPLPKSPLGF